MSRLGGTAFMQKTGPQHLLVVIARILEKLKIPYLVTGGIAVLVWGRPRFTADIDVVVELDEIGAPALIKALKSLGKAGYIDADVVREAIKQNGEFNFIDGDSGLKVDFWVLRKKDDFDIERLKRRKARTVMGEKIYFTSPEDLILVKLKWYKASHSSRQLEDVESIIKMSGEKLNMVYLKKWANKMGVTTILGKLI